MILDTTYLLPLARIEIDTDLLKAIADGKINWRLEEITVSLISIFELQAESAKLMIPTNYVSEAIEAIFKTFKVEPFYKPEIIAASFEIRRLIPDYLDCVIVATAVTLKEKLITEDSLILSEREELEKDYGISIQSYEDVVGS
jgi:PIN domain nuclease of toxin-antitoxin system